MAARAASAPSHTSATMGRRLAAWALLLAGLAVAVRGHSHHHRHGGDAGHHGGMGHTHRMYLTPEERHRHLLSAEVIPRVALTPLPDPAPSAPGRPVGHRRLLGDAGVSEAEAELEAPFGRRLALAFRAFGEDHRVELALNEQLFEPGAVTHATDDAGHPVVRRPVAVAYAGKFLHGGWIRATVHDDATVHALWLDKARGRLSMLVPADMYARKAPEVAAYAQRGGGRMLAFHVGDMVGMQDPHDRALLERWLGPHVFNTTPRPEAPHPLAAAAQHGMVRNETMRGLQSFADTLLENAVLNTLAPYGLMLGCPSTIYRAAIGVAVDTGYTKALTGLGSWNASMTAAEATTRVEKDVQQQLNIVNLLYSDMANVFVTIGQTRVYTSVVPGTEAWNQEPLDANLLTGANRKTYGCPISRSVTDDSDYQMTLTNFGNWRGALPTTERFALWHLLTDCYPPAGTVGLAYIGSTCTTNNQGASWASLQNEATWMTVAHEVGHNFGAYHTMNTGGIMSYDSITRKEYKFSGANPTEVCNHVNRAMGLCYTVQTATCGNGLLEPGEDCDDNSGCCDPVTCKLKAGAMCSPGLDNQCCRGNCTFFPTFTGCNVPGGTEIGYCFNGYCRFNRLAAAYSNLEGCAAPTTNPCKEYVRYNKGACTNTDASFQQSGFNMPDGAFCDDALTRRCRNGTCVVATPTLSPTRAPTGPTMSPTNMPTRAPTRVPTRPPTRTPTRTPTRQPTRAPTRTPTRQPTRAPTRTPTRAPTGPTRSPTLTPTFFRRHQRGLQEDSVQVDTGLPLDATPAPTPAGPAIVLSNPLLGEVLFNGAVAVVRWATTTELATVDLTLSDGTVVAAGLDAAAANGTYYWAVQAAPAMAYSLHIRGYPLDASAPVLEDESDQFAIQDQTTVVVTAPARDQVVLRGEAVAITWQTKGGTVTDVALAVVSAANASRVLADFGLQPNSGEFVWVPGPGLPLGRCAVRLVYSPPSAASVTAVGPAFRLRNPAADEGAITFLSPAEGEKLASGAPYVVLWSSPPSLTDAALYLLQPATGLNVTLFTGEDTNHFEWTVGTAADGSTIPPGAGYQLFMLDSSPAGDRVLNATSAPFDIYEVQPRVTITSIFDGQDGAMWVRGRDAHIHFTASDPADTITFEIQDALGEVIHTVTAAAPAAEGEFVYPVSYQVPPPDCFSCFLVAVSNLYPGVYHTFPMPFSIGSHEHSDLRAQQVEPSLTVTFPAPDAVLEWGKQYTITWEGVLIPFVAILLTNHTTEETTVLATVENTGAYEWALPLDPTIAGEYDLSLVAADLDMSAAIATPAHSHEGHVHFSIAAPPAAPGTPTLRFADEQGLATTWSEGETLTVAYTSEGVAEPVTIRVLSRSAGALFTAADAAPTSGSVAITLPAPPADPLQDAYIELSVASGAASPVQSPLATYYKAQGLGNVRVPAATLYKGQTYTVTWEATGQPFPVSVLLYTGTDARQTVDGQPCLPWRDTAGAEYTGCVLSYDLVNEICATVVDADGLWAEGGQCAPVSSTFKYVLLAAGGSGDGESPLLSTQVSAALSLAPSSTDLPAPGTEYSIVVSAASAGLKQAARSELFAVAESNVVLDFGIIRRNPEAAIEALRDLLLKFLSSTLGIDAARLTLQLTPTNPDADPTRFAAEATITRAEDTTVVSAYDAANVFLAIWAAPYSAQAAGLNAAVLELDDSVQPTLRYVEQAPAPPAAADPAADPAAASELAPPQEPEPAMPEEEPPVTQGLDVPEAPEIGPPQEIAPPLPMDVSGPFGGNGNQNKVKAAAAGPASGGGSGRAATSALPGQQHQQHQRIGQGRGIPRATLVGVAAAMALAAVLALVGVYAVRRHAAIPRGRTRSVLRVQSAGTGAEA